MLVYFLFLESLLPPGWLMVADGVWLMESGPRSDAVACLLLWD